MLRLVTGLVDIEEQNTPGLDTNLKLFNLANNERALGELSRFVLFKTYKILSYTPIGE